MFTDLQLKNFAHYMTTTPKSRLGKMPPLGAYDGAHGARSHGLRGGIPISAFSRGGAFDALSGESKPAGAEEVLKFLATKLSRSDWGALHDHLTGGSAQDSDDATSDALQRLQEFLLENLSPEAQASANTLVENLMDAMGGATAETEAEDEPDFPAAPQTGGGKAPGLRREPAMDAATARSFAEQFPAAAKVHVDRTYEHAPTRTRTSSAAGAKSFNEMFPNAAKVRTL